MQLPEAVCAVVVTYGPTAHTATLLHALAHQVGYLVVVDNGSTPDTLAAIRPACAELGAHLIELGSNTGIAHAQNIGILQAKKLGATFVLLSDQDSLPAPNMVALLLEGLSAGQNNRTNPCANKTLSKQRAIGAVGPYIAENKPGGDELIYVARRWGPRRATPTQIRTAIAQNTPIDASFLLASGCLIPLDVLADVGPMNEAYFIDHVDLEWCLRARRQGYRVLVAPRAHLSHSLGDRTVQLPGRAQPVHIHGPIRCYYLARNTIFLIRSGLLPRTWVVGYLVWLTKFAAFHTLLADQRPLRFRQLFAGLRDGITGRAGAR